MNITSRFDLESYLERFAPVLAQRSEVVITCPVCGKNKLVVNLEKQVWHCWVCEEYQLNLYGRRKAVAGAGGLTDLIQLLEGCSREQALSIIADQSRHLFVDIQQIDSKLKIDPSIEVRFSNEMPPPEGWKSISCYESLPYLRERGITPQDVVDFGLFYCDVGRYADRLIFPVWERGVLVYWQARAMREDVTDAKFRKTMNPDRLPGYASASEVLMNLDVARDYPRVALVEGPIDNIHVGFSACATFGKKISMTQALKLRYAGVRAIDLMWDGPSEREPLGAWPEMLRAANLLSGMFDVRLVFIPTGDPGIYSRAENNAFRARAIPASAVSRLARV